MDIRTITENAKSNHGRIMPLALHVLFPGSVYLPSIDDFSEEKDSRLQD